MTLKPLGYRRSICITNRIKKNLRSTKLKEINNLTTSKMFYCNTKLPQRCLSVHNLEEQM